MPSVSSVISDYRMLTPTEKNAVKSAIFATTMIGTDLNEYIEQHRFADGKVCPHCGGTHIVRNGKRPDGTQRYKCEDCGKRFVITANSIAFGTRKDLSAWRKYIECMLNGLSIIKSAKICGISKNTSFAWRHKILDALQNMASEVQLDGIVEADETFFSVSYKGNNKHSKTFSMPRKAHRRGNDVHKRGLSKEKVCVPCALNRTGHSIAMVSNLARIRIDGLQAVFGSRIKTGTVLVTDKASAYKQFANWNGLELHQLKSSAHLSRGIYHIQSVNNYHIQLKNFMAKFCGVSTKYLNNYLIWNNFANYKHGDWIEKCDKLLAFVLTTAFSENNSDISKRENLPILVK